MNKVRWTYLTLEIIDPNQVECWLLQEVDDKFEALELESEESSINAASHIASCFLNFLRLNFSPHPHMIFFRTLSALLVLISKTLSNEGFFKNGFMLKFQ